MSRNIRQTIKCHCLNKKDFNRVCPDLKEQFDVL